MEETPQQVDSNVFSSENKGLDKNLGLSFSPNLTAGIHTKKFINGEGTLRISQIGQLQGVFKPPRQEGPRISNSISKRARRRIRLACRIFQFLARQMNSTCALITLTFGKDYPNDKEAKKMLDMFLKRFRRH